MVQTVPSLEWLTEIKSKYLHRWVFTLETLIFPLDNWISQEHSILVHSHAKAFVLFYFEVSKKQLLMSKWKKRIF